MYKRHIGPMGGDMTSSYSISFDKEYTLQEFIKTTMEGYPDEFGWFSIYIGSWRRSEFSTEYDRGKLSKDIPSEYANDIVQGVGGSGGWGLSDYNILIRRN